MAKIKTDAKSIRAALDAYTLGLPHDGINTADEAIAISSSLIEHGYVEIEESMVPMLADIYEDGCADTARKNTEKAAVKSTWKTGERHFRMMGRKMRTDNTGDKPIGTYHKRVIGC